MFRAGRSWGHRAPASGGCRGMVLGCRAWWRRWMSIWASMKGHVMAGCEQAGVVRRHLKGDAQSVAVYSPCEAYRYELTRVWDEGAGRVVFVMLNPSTATEVQNDPTVERCERRARALGFGGFRVVNIFAFRATDPKVMRAQGDPVGPANDAAIVAAAHWGEQVICAWGSHGAHLGRGAVVESLLRATGRPLYQLGLTQAGAPKHPLYIGYAVQPEPWS